jgi:hypothetical protein
MPATGPIVIAVEPLSMQPVFHHHRALIVKIAAIRLSECQ